MRPVKRGSTDQSVVIRIIDVGDATPEMAVSSATAGIDTWYRRDGAAAVAITETSLANAAAAHADGGIVLIDDGYYRLDVPDAAFSASVAVDGVLIGGAVTSMIVIGCYVPLVNYDPYGTVFLTTGAIMASNFAAAAVNSAALGVSLGDILADTSELQVDWANGGRLDLLLDSMLVYDASGIAHDSSQNVALASLLAHSALIEADTNELQTDWVNSGRLDLLIDAILLDTGTSLVTILTAQDVALASLIAHSTNIVADTNELQTDWTNAGRLDALVDAILLDTGTSLVTMISATPAGVWNATAATYAAAGSMGEEQQAHALSTEITALNDLTAAEVNAEIVDALNVDTYAEPGAGAPAATNTIASKLGYLFKGWRNRKTATASLATVFNDDTTTPAHTAALSDDGSTFDHGEWGA